jgi:hypothetical protein
LGLVTVTLEKAGAAKDNTTQTRDWMVLITRPSAVRVGMRNRMEAGGERGALMNSAGTQLWGKDSSEELCERILARHHSAFNLGVIRLAVIRAKTLPDKV